MRTRCSGALGDDTYIVDNAGDVVIEAARQALTGVNSSISYALAANVENLTLRGSKTIHGTGNALANTITGNSAANTSPRPGARTLMFGGLGDDPYIVDNAGDQVMEGSAAGTDGVNSRISYTLGANVENLTLRGTKAVNGTGNELANSITGNWGSRRPATALLAADTMSGGLGDDSFTSSTMQAIW